MVEKSDLEKTKEKRKKNNNHVEAIIIIIRNEGSDQGSGREEDGS